MARSSSTTQVQVTVAVIGVVGAVATAAIANWDKIFPDPPAAKTEAAPPAATAAAIPAAAAKEVPAAAERPREVAAGPDEDSDGAVDIGGAWYGYDAAWRFKQNGDDYSYVGHRAGVQIASGEGRLTGYTLDHSYTGENGVGRCQGTVSADGLIIDGTCATNAGIGRAILYRRR